MNILKTASAKDETKNNINNKSMNKVKIYNTMTRRVTELVTMEEGKIKFFVCGPTVYDFPHLGHAKTYTQFDFIVKYLRWRGFEVNYLQNITDLG